MVLGTSITPPNSPNSPEGGHDDRHQLQVTNIKNSRRGGETTPMSINPLLLASACHGSSGALNFLFNREDAKAAPMILPTQAFLDLLVGHTPSRSTKIRLIVLHGSGGVEDNVDQLDLQATTPLLKGITAEGDTTLHVVASHGDSLEFMECANIIVKRDHTLLFDLNNKGDTPLHCAARAGNSKMLSCLIELARSHKRLHELLRKENMLKETALHDAVRIGNNGIVLSLLAADSELANYPKEGTSPLYLAISLQQDIIARTLHEKSDGNLSYFGPNGQNALHAAILRGKGSIKDLLEWNNSLTTYVDKDGCTPLHFASSFWYSDGFKELFRANPAPVYQADNNGLFPIHSAASVGAKDTIRFIIEKCPSSARLCTAQGRTLLHVAVEKARLNIVSFVCRTSSLAWILNMQDNDGNTAMHLAVLARELRVFCSLYRNKEVRLNLTNKNGQTPLDLSRSLLSPGMHYIENTDRKIHMALTMVDPKHSALRWDEFHEMYIRPLKPKDAITEAEKVKDSSQMLGIGSVLIATVTFGATFAVPGGFIADDHVNGGTPTLAGTYTFDAFIMANTIAFLCSTISTVGLVFSGSSMVDLRTRKIYMGASVLFMESSATSLSVAFALGVFMVLQKVALPTAIVVAVLTPIGVLSGNFEYIVKWAILIQPLCVRVGYLAHWRFTGLLLAQMFMTVWPVILIFGWAAIAWSIRNH